MTFNRNAARSVESRRSALMIGAVAIALGLTASPATAAYDFHNGSLISGGIAESNFEALRATLGWADSSAHKAQVAAANSAGIYGSWVDGWGTACHSYAGTTVLKGLLRNPHSVTQNPMRGRVRVAPEIACGSFGRVAPVGEVSPEISATFAIFRDRAASPVPVEIAKTAIPPSLHGADAGLARRIMTTTGTGWVVPARDHICIVQPDPVDGHGTVCTAVAQAKRAGLVLTLREHPELGDGTSTVLVPDGLHLQSVGSAGSAVVADRRRLAANDGVASLTVPAGTELTPSK